VLNVTRRIPPAREVGKSGHVEDSPERLARHTEEDVAASDSPDLGQGFARMVKVLQDFGRDDKVEGVALKTELVNRLGRETDSICRRDEGIEYLRREIYSVDFLQGVPLTHQLGQAAFTTANFQHKFAVEIRGEPLYGPQEAPKQESGHWIAR
jgi:hypothetical protein